MQETPSIEYVEAERTELELVAACLSRTPRLEQLLRYLATKYFDDETDELTEYNIATEVFGRKKTEFIASQDSIARVETHRLRKKLTAFYEGEGKDHAIQISIPLGTYVPTFVERVVQNDRLGQPEVALREPALGATESRPFSEREPLTGRDVESAPAPIGQNASALAHSKPGRRFGLYALAALILAIGVISWARFHSNIATKPQPAGQYPKPTSAANDVSNSTRHQANGTGVLPLVSLPFHMSPVSLPFRMIAGYTGGAQNDNAGKLWQPDEYFHEGRPRHVSQAFIARSSNPLIFRYGRDGDFSYDIPLAPGVYELHLYFMQGSDAAQPEDAENVFNVTLNRELALRNFDIVADAMGRNTGDERVFRDVSPASDGILHIGLSGVLGTPSLSAIEILAGAPHHQLPTRVVMQPASFTDSQDQLWRPDDYFLGGRYLSHNIPVSNSDPEVRPFERYGHFEYAVPVDPRDRYTLTLYFVELYFGTKKSTLSDERLFRVLCNGQTLLDDFDILKEAGPFHTLKKTFYGLKPTAQGKLNIDFEPVSNYATVSAIEVLDESK